MQCSLPHRDDLEIAPVHCMEENFPRGAFPLPAPLNRGALQDVGGTAATAFPVGSSEPRKQRRQEEEAEAGAAARGCLHTSLLGLAPRRDLSSLRGPGVGTPRTGLRTGTPAARPAMPGRALPGAAPRTLAAWLWVCALGRLCTAGFPETPRPCQAPQQWEGRQVLFLQSSGHNSRALLSYDGPNQRLRVLDEKKALIPCKRLFEYILLYKEGVMFQIEQATKQCSKIPLTVAWDPLDIPDNSTFEDQYSIGGPQEQITVQEWSNRKSARTYETWIGVYTAKDCYPVQETFIQNYTVVLSTRFFDVQLGIKDPSVFTPPSTCQMAQTEKMSEDCAW